MHGRKAWIPGHEVIAAKGKNPQPSSQPVYELEGVSYGYGTQDVLRGIDLHIPSEAILLVLGANGSGKTTLLKLLAGVLTPRQGTIRRRVTQDKVAALGHETFIYPGLSVLENLTFWMGLYARSREQESIDQVLERAGLSGVMYEPAGHLSRGMSQRLSLARIVLLCPEVLLLDEPTSGLDAASQEMMREEIRRARERGATVLWITHAQERDMPMADALLQVHGGRVQWQEAGRG